MNRFFFVFCAMIMLGAGCGSSSTVVPAATTAPTQASPSPSVNEVETSVKIISPSIHESEKASSVPIADPVPLSITMTSGNFFFDPATITASPGQSVSVTFTGNEGVHTFVIDELELKKTISVGTVVTFTAPSTPGSYAYYCDIGAHRKLGMEGVLVVK